MGRKAFSFFVAALVLQLLNIDIPTRIFKIMEKLIVHFFSTNQQITKWKICLPSFDFDHNIFFSEQTFL